MSSDRENELVQRVLKIQFSRKSMLANFDDLGHADLGSAVDEYVHLLLRLGLDQPHVAVAYLDSVERHYPR